MWMRPQGELGSKTWKRHPTISKGVELTRFHFLSTPETQLDDSLTRYFPYGYLWCSSQLKSSDSECMRTQTANSRSQWQWSSKWKEYTLSKQAVQCSQKKSHVSEVSILYVFFCVFFDCAIPAQSLARLWNSRGKAQLEGKGGLAILITSNLSRSAFSCCEYTFHCSNGSNDFQCFFSFMLPVFSMNPFFPKHGSNLPVHFILEGLCIL